MHQDAIKVLARDHGVSPRVSGLPNILLLPFDWRACCSEYLLHSIGNLRSDTIPREKSCCHGFRTECSKDGRGSPTFPRSGHRLQ